MSKKKKQKVFIVGGNYADGSRFEIGDVVPSDLDAAELKVLQKMGTIGDPEEAPEKDEE